MLNALIHARKPTFLTQCICVYTVKSGVLGCLVLNITTIAVNSFIIGITLLFLTGIKYVSSSVYTIPLARCRWT